MLVQNWEFFGHDARALPGDAERADAVCARKNAPGVVLGEIGFDLLITLTMVLAVNLALGFFHMG